MTELSAAAIRRHLTNRRLGRDILVVQSAGSTMDLLGELASGGAAEGTVVLADRQAAGRGRLGRTWSAPPGTAVLMSVLFRPPLDPGRLAQVPMAMALGVVDGLAATLRPAPDLGLKWPNDVVWQDRKLAGLLAEVDWAPDGSAELRLGVGLNVTQSPDALPEGAVSLALLVDRPPPRALLVAAILDAAASHYEALLAGAELGPRWAARLVTLGRDVTAQTPGGSLQGRALGVTAEGWLRLVDEAGQEHLLQAGDVTLASRR